MGRDRRRSTIPIEEDRYVKALEIREVNDVPTEGTGRQTVGGRWIYHHLIYRTEDPDGETQGWPVHEVGRNPDYFPEGAGRLLRAGPQILSESAHMHSTGITTTGRTSSSASSSTPRTTSPSTGARG